MPDVPNIKDFGKLVRNRDEKIQELIINPKDKMIQDLQEKNSLLTYTLERQIKTVDKAVKYEKEKKSILTENTELKEKCENIETVYSAKLKEETKKIEKKYENRIYELENENNFLRKIIHTLQKTVDKFIHWVCLKFSVSEEEEFIRNFEFENDTYLDPEKQIEYEEELDYEEREW